MSATLLLVSFAIAVVGAILSLITARSHSASKAISAIFGIVSSAIGVASGLIAIAVPQALVSFASPFPFAQFSVNIDPMRGLFISLIAALGFVAWIYGLSYFDEYKGKTGRIGFYLNLFVSSMLMVVGVDNAFWFIVFFELMSLSSYFLVIVEQSKAAIKGGMLYFVMAHIGLTLIMISFFIMAAEAGSFEFSAFRELSLSAPVASAVFITGFLGFGIKAGMFPFHSWLPAAHPEAPSNVSALMSGGMVKIGIFGGILVAFDLLSGCDIQLWWGLAVIAFGAASAIIGIIYAIGQRDLKRLLAYSTVDNVGVILLGFGTALTAAALNEPLIATIGLTACLFHCVNHAMFKGMLFMGAGSVLFRTGTRDMDKLGGLAKFMPVTAACFFIGVIAICAIPPLNGFASEWMAYQSFFDLAFISNPLVQGFAALAGVALAITGAFTVVCFVKAYGVTFGGMCRVESTEDLRESPAPMLVALVICLIACVILGVCASWIVPWIESAASITVGTGASAMVAAGAFMVNPIADGAISTLLIAILAIIVAAIVLAIHRMHQNKGGVGERKDPWDCGYGPEREMAPIADTFAATTELFFGPAYRLRERILSWKPGIASGFAAFVDSVRNGAEPAFDKYLVDTTSAFVAFVGRQSRKVQNGDFRAYVFYVVVALVFFLVLAVVTG